jgi:transcriptional regulator with XRE-family HTH domain
MPNRRYVQSSLKNLIFQQAISQCQVAKDIGISYLYFNRVVNGWEKGSPELQKKISEYFNVPISNIFNDE